MRNIKKSVSLFCTLFVFTQQGHALNNRPPVGDTPDTIYLRLDCGTMPNCFEGMGDLLDWAWNERQPSAGNPLLVDIGAGTFNIGTSVWLKNNGNTGRAADEKIFCDGGGYTTFRGAGRENTILTGKGISNSPSAGFPIDKAAMEIRDCTQLAFQDMSIYGQDLITADQPEVNILSGSNSHHGIFWFGGGSSTWSNVELRGGTYGWVDACLADNDVGTHKWFGSSVTSGPFGYYNVAYRSECGLTEYFGGDIVSIKGSDSASATLVAVQTAGNKGNIAIYGALVRAVISETGSVGYSNQSQNNGSANGHGGLHANGGTIHMHGGITSVLADVLSVDSDVFGVKVESGGVLHTPDTAFGLKPGGAGEAQRVIGVGAQSPFQWPSASVAPNITSQNGADMFIETDCANNGDCDSPGGSETHVMIFNDNCVAAGPWFNSTLGACRGVDPSL